MDRIELERDEEGSDIDIITPVKTHKSQSFTPRAQHGLNKLECEPLQQPFSSSIMHNLDSPRTKFVSKKFKNFDPDEKMQDSFACACANQTLIL